MKVLQFGRFWNDQHGGVERHAALLCKGLAEQKLDVVNLVAAADAQGDDCERDGYRLVQVPAYGRFASTAIAPGLPFKAMALHRQKPFDIFHLHLPDPLSHLASLMLPRDVPRVITWHSDVVRQRWLLALYLPLLQSEVRRADALVVATAAHFAASSQIPEDLGPDRRHVIPFGLDYAPLSLTAKVATRRDELRRATGQGKPVLFALGRHVYYKGFDVLISAMRDIDAHLLLGGSGPLTAELQATARGLGVQDRITFTGRIPEDELAAYFHACDLFCLPSVEQSEAFGLVQLEAMACGKPVVCTQLHNGVNVVNLDGVTGLAVPPGDAAALAVAINSLLADQGRMSRYGAQAAQRAHDIYSLENMTQQTIALYRRLAARPHA